MRVAPEHPLDSDDFTSRKTIVWVAIIEIVCLLVIVASFWAAYVWPIIVVSLGAIGAVVCLVHFSAASEAKYNTCCCTAASAPKSLLMYSAVLLVLALVGIATSIIAAVFYDSTQRIFAIVCSFGLLFLAAAESYKIVLLRRLQSEFSTWEMTRAAHSVTIAPMSHVVSGQPIITSPQGGFQASQTYPGMFASQYPGPIVYTPRVDTPDVPPFVSNAQPYNDEVYGY